MLGILLAGQITSATGLAVPPSSDSSSSLVTTVASYQGTKTLVVIGKIAIVEVRQIVTSSAVVVAVEIIVAKKD